MSKTALVIMAAGLGSRYGSLKQIDRFGPSGETLMEYSVYDAIRAGFDKVVFVIRPEMESCIRKLCGDRIAKYVDVSYAFQSFDQLPDSFVFPASRNKPYGTVHALLAARPVVTSPFAIINADDFYGASVFQAMFRAAYKLAPVGQACMPAYLLQNTLSANGAVNRGVCNIENNKLKEIQEIHHVSVASASSLSTDTMVSMNFWGFTPWIFSAAQKYFERFLYALNTNEKNAECVLPDMVDFLIHNKSLSVSVLPTKSKWIGVTYPNDKQFVQQQLHQFVYNHIYPEKLFW